MYFNQANNYAEIRELHQKLDKKRRALDEGLKNEMSFGDLRVLYLEIKELSKRLHVCFEEARTQKQL
ncbi:MAG TPA: hypothetical protein VD794_14460 [Flavisolibacter sp.]|nr:hypothetical protein [Flavisolibacter sp.]